MRRSQWFGFWGVIICLGLPPLMSGQATSSTISGIVRDSSQAVVAGAAITVMNTGTGISRTSQSDAAGRYRVGELQPGTYQVSVTITGFATETRKGIALQVGQEQTLNFALQVGTVEQQVEVTGAAPLVETATAAVASNVSQEQLRELPLNGRSFTDLITLQPGAVAPSNAVLTGPGGASLSNGPQLSVSGARPDANAFMIDGTDMNPTSNATPGSAARVQLGVDTIREYQVITSNAKAEYGRNAGGFINAVSRSGTNEWHGSAFEFLRNSTLDARDFFDGNSTPPFKRNQFGATLGGPIKKDKTFVFLGYEGLRQRLSQTFVWTVPTPEARRGIGILSAGQTVDPRVLPYLNLYPLPNGANLGGVAEFNQEIAQPLGENYGSVRVDHNFSGNDFLFGRYTIDRGNRVQFQTLLSNSNFFTANQYLTLQEDHIFSPTLLNMFRAGYNRSLNNFFPDFVPNAEALSFVPGVPMGSLSPGSGNSAIGPNQIATLFQAQNVYQFEDNLTYTRGPHTMKFGVSLERFQWNTDQRNNVQGAYTFNTFGNFLQAGPSGVSTTIQLPGSISYRHIRSTLPSFFAQDDYRVTPRLTLNIGLRWEFTTGLSELNNYLVYMRRGPYLSALSDLILGELWENHIIHLEPRLGFNWGLDQSGKTALSGGFGIFHNEVLHNAMIAERFQLPLLIRGNVSNVSATATFPNIVATTTANSTGGFSNTETRHYDHDHFKTPTFYRYNLTLQRELPGEMALRVGYVGATGFHNKREQLLNRNPQPVVQADGSLYFPSATEAPQFTNPNFGAIRFMSSDSNSWYSALTASLQKRFSKGLMFQGSYTYSKSIDDFSGDETNYNGEGRDGQFGPDRHLDRARSSFNVPHVFVFNSLYELPVGTGKRWLNSAGVANAVLGGWQAGGIVTIQQGVPFTVGSSATYPGYQFNAIRPNLKPGIDVKKLTGIPSDAKGTGAASRYFDATAFSVPAAGTVGNAARSLLLGPPLKTVSFTLTKSFNLWERSRLQFRSEFFNLFNHTNFSNPNGTVFTATTGAISPTVGRITSTSAKSRQIQFGLKLTF